MHDMHQVEDQMGRREFGRRLGLMGLAGVLPVELPRSRWPGVEPGTPPEVGLGVHSGGGHGISTDTSSRPDAANHSAIDVARARRETPGCTRVAHFNNAGAALPPQPVLDALLGHLQEEANVGGYEAADAAANQRQSTYQAIARLLGCSPDEIALVENATRGWDMAFYSLRFRPGERILTSAAEYASNYIAYLQVARQTGAVIEVIPNDEHGQVSLEAMERSLAKGGVGLVGLTHVPTNGGLVNPAEEVGRLTRAAGVPYLLDACQSVGQWPVDVEAIGCDMLSVTGRKFLRGPRATGFLYVRRSMIERMEPPLLDLHAAEWVERDRFEIHPTARRFENWEQYVAGHIALGVAAEYAMHWGMEAIRRRVTTLAEALRTALSEVPGVMVRDLGRERCGIVSFTVEGMDPALIRDTLRRRQFNVSVTSLSSTRLDMEARGIQSMVRASVHYYNTEEEVEELVTHVKEMARGGRER
jgi:cysteine desulfurase / selenocysteine lyase